MPNLDFYAGKNDLEAVLTFVFEGLDCRVFESYSAYDSELIEFESPNQLRSRKDFGFCSRLTQSTRLQLWPVKSSENVRIRKIQFDPMKVKGATYRHCLEGWGLIQLYLGGLNEMGVVHSHTNHNSKKRALRWSDTLRQRLGDPGDWGWDVVEAQSRKLNRHIRKLAVAKLGSRPVLPHAQQLVESGASCIP